jgi:membrane protein
MANPIERLVTTLRERVPGLDTAMTVHERVGMIGGGPASSALALTAFLTLFPLLLVAIAVVGFFAADDIDFPARMVENLGLHGQAARMVLDAIDTAEKSRRTATVIGIVGLLWGGLALVASLEAVLNSVWQVRGFGITGKLRHLAWLAVTGILLVASMTIGPLLNVLPGPAVVATLLLGVVVDSILMFWTFHQLTNAPVLSKAHLPGAIVGGVGLAVLKAVGGVWVPRMVTQSSGLYGSIGVVFAVLAWMILAAKLFVYAASFNVVRYEQKHGTVTVELQVPHIEGHVPMDATRGGAVNSSAAPS